jgi:hypothetical protein
LTKIFNNLAKILSAIRPKKIRPNCPNNPEIPVFVRQYFETYEAYLMWCAWWVGLGVLSSVGFGTGLHTFLLYLGPHIAAVSCIPAAEIFKKITRPMG